MTRAPPRPVPQRVAFGDLFDLGEPCRERVRPLRRTAAVAQMACALRAAVHGPLSDTHLGQTDARETWRAHLLLREHARAVFARELGAQRGQL